MNFLIPVRTALKKGGSFLSRHSPEILTVAGTGGVITSVIFAIRATPKALQLIEQEKQATGKEKLTVIETVRTAWKPYIMTAATTVLTIGCFVGAQAVNGVQKAALASLCATTKETLKAYQQEVVETIGADKEKEIRDRLEQKKLEPTPVKPLTMIGNGRQLFSIHGYLFRATEREIVRAENRLNRRMYVGHEMYISLNDILDELDLPHDEISGDKLGLSIDDGVEMDIDSNFGLTEDGEVYRIIQFGTELHENYMRMYS